jgi:hypothetical protein
MPEVSAESKDLYASVVEGGPLKNLRRRIRAPIIHEDDLPRLSAKRFAKAREHQRYRARLVQHRNDDRQKHK